LAIIVAAMEVKSTRVGVLPRERQDSMRGPSVTVDLITPAASDSGRLAHTFLSPAEATNKHHILLLSLRGNPRRAGGRTLSQGCAFLLESCADGTRAESAAMPPRDKLVLLSIWIDLSKISVPSAR